MWKTNRSSSPNPAWAPRCDANLTACIPQWRTLSYQDWHQTTIHGAFGALSVQLVPEITHTHTELLQVCEFSGHQIQVFNPQQLKMLGSMTLTPCKILMSFAKAYGCHYQEIPGGGVTSITSREAEGKSEGVKSEWTEKGVTRGLMKFCLMDMMTMWRARLELGPEVGPNTWHQVSPKAYLMHWVGPDAMSTLASMAQIAPKPADQKLKAANADDAVIPIYLLNTRITTKSGEGTLGLMASAPTHWGPIHWENVLDMLQKVGLGFWKWWVTKSFWSCSKHQASTWPQQMICITCIASCRLCMSKGRPKHIPWICFTHTAHKSKLGRCGWLH